MADSTSADGKGLLNSMTTLVGSLVNIVYTRLELLSTDLEEDRQHLLSLVILSLVALFSLVIGVVLVAILLVVIFWDTHRLLTLASLAGLFLMTGLITCGFVLRKTRTKPRLFLASLLELLKDRERLNPP